jgi:uncharacterized protein YbcC (UPF0753/DUF2309 family)
VSLPDVSTASASASSESLAAAIERACARIAPTWPLDRFLAVNPLWGFVEEPLPQVAARLASLSGARCVMPRAWFRDAWREGRFTARHLERAIAESGESVALEELLRSLDVEEPEARPRATVCDLLDRALDTGRSPSWRELATHAISQFCAAFFDDGQARVGPDRTGGLYAAWLRHVAHDHTPRLLMGLAGFGELVRALPQTPAALRTVALEELGVPEAEREAYLTALLLGVNGWAAWCAYLRWQARLAGGDDDHLPQLLAIRAAWELLLFRAHRARGLEVPWRAELASWPGLEERSREAQRVDWLLQRALELAYQEPLRRELVAACAAPRAQAEPPRVQMAFCIDVRSEVFRRALESSDPEIATLGFAGFFGAPLEYRALGACDARPQLPGLLAPTLRAEDVGAPRALAARRSFRLEASRVWKSFKGAAVSAFSFVEGLGLLYAGKLVSDSVGATRPVPDPERAGLSAAELGQRKPRLAGRVGGAALSAADRAALAAGILRAMSLTRGFARLVVLAGHGSRSVNNPHAAGLDCGACCGQTGEVNARAVAALLNEPAVRAALAEAGIAIPDSTHFLAALHETTTDRVVLFDQDELPASHREDFAALARALQAAGLRARAERAAALGLAQLEEPSTLARAVARRASDWSQVRPEWGLANNAAFVVAPRERTRGLDLEGRAFLHEYRWQEDTDFSVLELILTAPMVVTHWINFQYYASTVENRRYGSGNKVLHNVVGGHLGVFEGNGGDLRIGLPLQSLHDGQRWVHTPLRLSVFLEAPREAIDRVLARHERVRQLVENGWLHLFQIDATEGVVWRRARSGWMEDEGVEVQVEQGRRRHFQMAGA